MTRGARIALAGLLPAALAACGRPAGVAPGDALPAVAPATAPARTTAASRVVEFAVTPPPVPASDSERDRPGRPPTRWYRQPAMLQSRDDTGRIVVRHPAEHAARVAVGAPLVVTIRSLGGGCLAAGGATAEVSAHRARIEAWDYTSVPPGPAGADVACAAYAALFARRLAIRFDRPGRASIEVHGLGHAPGRPEPVVLRSEVDVH